MAASINYPGSLDGDATVGGGNEPDGTTALDDNTSGHPKHSVLHQNVGEAIQQIQTKLGTGAASPSANKVLVSSGTSSTWGQITAAMIASGQSPTFTNITGTLATAAQPNITSVGTLTSVASNGAITGNSVSTVGGIEAGGTFSSSTGSATTPSYNFTGDTNTGMYRSAANELSFATDGTRRVTINSAGVLSWTGTSALSGPLALTTSSSGYHYVMQNDYYGTFWKFASVRDTKEQITNVTAEDSGRWIDALQPVTYISRWLGEGDEPADARAFRLADVQVGFIADDVLANSDTDHFAQVSDNGHGGLDPEGWKWECVIAAAVAEIKSLRARVTALEG